jgi:hypothetical protein
MANRPSRGRGILNDRQRAYLTDESDIESGSANERSIRQAIRNNLQNALLDMVILERNLEERDRRQVFDSFDATRYDDDSVDHPGSDYEHEVALGELLAFLYRGLDGRRPTFDELLQYAIPRAKHPDSAPFHPEYDIELQIEQLEPGPDDLEAAIRHVANDQLNAMTDTEIRAFLRMLRASDTVDTRTLYTEYEARAAAVEHDGADTQLSLQEFLAASVEWAETAEETDE